MALIGTLVSFTAGSKIVSADVNANFSAIRSAFNTSAVLSDTATTITVTHTFTVSQNFQAGITTSATSTLHGHLLFSADATYDIGAPGATRPRDVLVGRNLRVAGQSALGGAIPQVNKALALQADSASADQLYLVDANSSPKTTWTVGLSTGSNFDGIGWFSDSLRFRMMATGAWIVAGQSITNTLLVTGNVTCAAALNVAGAIVVTGNATIAGLATLGGTNAAGSFAIVNTMTTALSNEFAIATTFNSPGNDLTALRIAVTDTSSAAGAKLFSAANGANTVFKIPKEGGAITQAVTLATAATAGFLYIPTMGSTATGTPAAQTGTVPIAYETGNNHLMVYAGGAWKQVALT